MKLTGIIPARYNSSRFPGKSIALLNGVPVVVHVYRQAAMFSKWHHLVVATDDVKVVSVCEDYNVPVLMTSSEHKDCIDRAAEVSGRIESDRYIIIQGDEPFFDASILEVDLSPDVVGFYTHIDEDLDNPHLVKVVLDFQERALYFSRTKIPFGFKQTQRSSTEHPVCKQIGLYSFSGAMLRVFVGLGTSPLEDVEGVGLLRLLENGYTVHMRYADYVGMEIDTPEDLAKAEELCQRNS